MGGFFSYKPSGPFYKLRDLPSRKAKKHRDEIFSGSRKSERPHSFEITTQQYNKKRVSFDQGLDFLKVWRGKSMKKQGKSRKNAGNLRVSGSNFLTKRHIISLCGCKFGGFEVRNFGINPDGLGGGGRKDKRKKSVLQ